jgi:hypothetical protein
MKQLIKEFDKVIKSFAVATVVTLIFRSFGENIITPFINKAIPTQDDRPSFKHFLKTLIEASMTLALFFIVYSTFVFVTSRLL